MNGRTNVTTGTNTDVLEVPLDPVTSFVAEEGTGKVLLSWTDPKDKYATPEGELAQDPQQLVSVWSHTVIVRKEGSDPVDENDGVVIVSSSVRNQYASSQYTDANVSNGIEYHYGAFAINEDGIASDGMYNSATPRVYDTVLANNTWAQIDEACSLGVAESFWEVGDEHELLMTVDGSQKDVRAIIIGFNQNPLSDKSGNAVISFITKDHCGRYRYFPATEDRGYLMYFGDSELRTNLNNSIFNSIIDSNLKTAILSIDRYDYRNDVSAATDDNEILFVSAPHSNKLFPLGYKELNGDMSLFKNPEQFDRHEITYPYFATQSNRNKGFDWWTSLGYKNGSSWYECAMYYVQSNGTLNAYTYSQTAGNSGMVGEQPMHYVCFAFCIGKLAA